MSSRYFYAILINMENNNQIVIYTDNAKNIHLEVQIQDESIWLTQKQIAGLFSVQRPAITKHLVNIFKSGELKEKSVSSKMEHTAADGKVYTTALYSLDAIISVGYRVNSKQATQFRIWATGILKEHILKGYTFNEKRLKENQTIKLKELEKTVSLLQGVIRSKALNDAEAKGLLSVITDYAHSWILLQQYDAGSLQTKKSVTKGIAYIGIEESANAILTLREHLRKRKENTDVFAVERHHGAIEGIFNSIRQSFGGKELYPSLEEKAAHLLYFIIKQHPLVDGNKRVASLLFIVFLTKNKYLYRKDGERKINDNALVALTLLIAESDPKDKDIIIKIVKNLIAL